MQFVVGLAKKTWMTCSLLSIVPGSGPALEWEEVDDRVEEGVFALRSSLMQAILVEGHLDHLKVVCQELGSSSFRALE